MHVDVRVRIYYIYIYIYIKYAIYISSKINTNQKEWIIFLYYLTLASNDIKNKYKLFE